MKFTFYIGPVEAPMIVVNERNIWHWVVTAIIMGFLGWLCVG